MLCQIHGLGSLVSVGIVELLRIVLGLIYDSVSQNLIRGVLLELTRELQIRHRLVLSLQVDGLVSIVLLLKIFPDDEFFLDGILVSSHETFIILSVFDLGRWRILVGRSWLDQSLFALLPKLTLELELLQMEQIVALRGISTDIVDSALFEILIRGLSQ